MSLSGKVALVTDGNGGIGLSQQCAAAVATISALGGLALFLEFDISDTAATTEHIKKPSAAEGRLDILVNNAGINVRKREWKWHLIGVCAIWPDAVRLGHFRDF